jgi:hypothetical protein
MDAQFLSMTDEEITKFIAEKCPEVAGMNADQSWVWKKHPFLYFSPLTDLNAMHEAEKTLSMGQLVEYGNHLNHMELTYSYGYVETVINATARQRAGAFVMCASVRDRASGASASP